MAACLPAPAVCCIGQTAQIDLCNTPPGFRFLSPDDAREPRSRICFAGKAQHRLLLERVVTQTLGWTFDSAASSGVAWQIMTQFRPDLVIGDISPPELDGIDLLRRLRCQPDLAETPVVLIGSPDEIIGAQDQGCQALLSKPFRLKVLLAVLLILAPAPA